MLQHSKGDSAVLRTELGCAACPSFALQDENRAKCQLALKAGKFYTSVTNMCVW